MSVDKRDFYEDEDEIIIDLGALLHDFIKGIRRFWWLGLLLFVEYYPLGEVRDIYSRAGLGKLDELHYLLVAVNEENGYWRVPTMDRFADQMMSFGCEKAYALDGGQTAAIVTNDKLINRPDFGNQRTVSDIIYFATAVPNGG